ncbi:MAG TPA: chemotaxis protein CheX [Candidatus Eremiobacteraceae bacterium]|nr:chemotaxis protein CheX [Candidatus Eremiobacteraceae bacterium]
MNSSNEVLAVGNKQEGWCGLLELATREVFQLMLASDLTAPTAEITLPHEVTSMVGLAGQLCGVLSVRCDEKSAALMTSKMLGVEIDKVGADMSDALGEICNMVAGNFKNKITGLGDGCMLSPPTVITGSDYTTYSVADKPALEVRLMFEAMPIVISLEIHS